MYLLNHIHRIEDEARLAEEKRAFEEAEAAR